MTWTNLFLFTRFRHGSCRSRRVSSGGRSALCGLGVPRAQLWVPVGAEAVLVRRVIDQMLAQAGWAVHRTSRRRISRR